MAARLRLTCVRDSGRATSLALVVPVRRAQTDGLARKAGPKDRTQSLATATKIRNLPVRSITSAR